MMGQGVVSRDIHPVDRLRKSEGRVFQPKAVVFNGHADADGMELVEAWECEAGCLSHDLEAGGSSRFFKQVHSMTKETFPQDLVEYLCNMIGAPGFPETAEEPEKPAEPGVYWETLDDARMATFGDNSIPGLIVHGTPTEAQVVELMRILRPGAHLLLVAPESQPTGHTGAIRLEDGGFEIRDAILLPQEEGILFYEPKASRAEREAGCWGLAWKTGAEAVDREEDTAGLDSPAAGAGRTAERVKNHHPTVKPIGIMAKLLEDVPKDIVAGDPFMGSGTTGAACGATGHSFVGIEREPEYFKIADARVWHWDVQNALHRNPNLRGDVISDLPGEREVKITKKPEVKSGETSSLFDFFWEEK